MDKLKSSIPKKYHDLIADTIYKKNDENFKVTISQLILKLQKYQCKHIIITGGEPLLQKNSIIKFIDALLPDGYTFEIETNGTIDPDGLSEHIKFNVSPKLGNSFNSIEKRYYPEILKHFTLIDAIFKFVINNENDLFEVKQIQNEIGFPSNKIYLMPEGQNRTHIIEKSRWIIGLCKKNNYNYSHRLHIEIFDDLRGV